MSQSFSVKLSAFVIEKELELLYIPPNYEDIVLITEDVNRPDLQLVGFYDYFDKNRIQIFGLQEFTFVETLSYEVRFKALETLFSQGIPAMVITRSIEPLPEQLSLAEKYGVTLLRTPKATTEFMGETVTFLMAQLAPRITRHGVLVEVYGEGLLILGESGIGKSETAIELVKRGHRLIADDAVEIRKTTHNTLIGSAPELIRHYMELRGIGVIDVRKLFGIGSVKDNEKIDLIVSIEQWNDDIPYDRLGLDNQYTDIMGVKIPTMTVPVSYGRNLAVIIEVAAMNFRQKKMGHNAALEFTEQINKHFDKTYAQNTEPKPTP